MDIVDKIMKQIGLIGNFCGDIIGGQAEKTRVLYKELSIRFGSVLKADVYRRNPIDIFFLICNVFRKCDRIIIILASPGYFKLQSFLIYCNMFFHRELFEFVIGGIRYQYLQGKSKRIHREQKIRKIYVESLYMVEQYGRLGLYNVAYVPNFKKIEQVADISRIDMEMMKKHLYDEGLKLCTFSRIDRYKGIDTAIEIVAKAREVWKMKVSLDIIGPIDEEYKEIFYKRLESTSENAIRYCGSVPSARAFDTIRGYDALLFTTHWSAEGFPGTFIDAMAAGLPILATDKPNFRGIVINGYNGWLIDEWNIDDYIMKIKEFEQKPEILLQMKGNAVEEVKKYKTETVLSGIFDDLET